MDQRYSIKLAMLLIAQLGCGDDDERGGSKGSVTSSVETSCSEICDRMEAARCGVDLARCDALCEQQYAQTPARCRAGADQLLDCASKATFSCDAEGPTATFCAPLEAALDVCSGEPAGPVADAGQPAASDAGSPLTSSADAQASTPARDAGTPAGDAAVANTSGDAGRADASAPRSDAGSDAAVTPLSCEPAADDEACDVCLKGSCCAQFSACGVGSDCLALVDCIDSCETSSCYDACEAAHPEGAIAFDKVLDCSANRCSSVCEDDEPTPSEGARPPPADKCLPTFAPDGVCSDPSKPVGYDCRGQPFSDCVALPNVSDVYCCGRGN